VVNLAGRKVRGATMLNSMTGYASRQGVIAFGDTRISWDWDLRSVNGRGLDLRSRFPEGYGFIEKTLRDRLAAQIVRGTVTLSLRLRLERENGPFVLNETVLQQLFQTLARLQKQAKQTGVILQAPSALDVLTWRGSQVSDHDSATFDAAELGQKLTDDFAPLLADFCAARGLEGAALHEILSDQIARIAALVTQARAVVPRRAEALRATFQTILAQFSDDPRLDPARLEQELAVLAVKADLGEELDRLDAHCQSARAMLMQGGPVGRRLDFLTQEFNREANTLCAKAQHLELTRIGLALKSVIDQMREQVQNLE